MSDIAGKRGRDDKDAPAKQEEAAHLPPPQSQQSFMGEIAHRFSDNKSAATSPLARVESERKSSASAAVSRIMRKADGAGSGGKADIPQGGGTSLPSEVRQKMEPKLGADLSGVKVHTSGASAQASASYGARAFTVGSDVHFGAGQFAPGTKEGDRLIAHELTHVVQGGKQGVQRKAEEDDAKGGDEKSADVSQPEEPAEKEADAVGDKVADELHDAKGGGGGGGGKDEKKKGGKGKGKDGKKDGAHAKEDEGKDGGEAGKEGEGADEAKEKPAAQISAKLEGVGTKLFRAKAKDTPAQVAPGTINGTTSKMTVNPTSTNSDPSSKFGKSVSKYETNFGAAVAKIQGKGGTPEDVAKITAKKQEWYQKWGAAVLHADATIAQKIFTDIEGELKTLFPDDSSSKDGGSLYTGRTNNPAPGGGAQTGRQRAEDATQKGNAKKNGITYRTLETSLIGSLFDGVANDPQDAAEKQHWIPYSGSKAGAWWSQVSASYANTFTGEVNAFVDIGFPYMVDKFVKNKGWTSDQAKAKKAELAAVIALDGSVFKNDELPRLADGMKEGRVSRLVVQLRLETSAGVFKTATVTVDGTGVSGGAVLISKVDAGIASHVTVDDIFKNIK